MERPPPIPELPELTREQLEQLPKDKLIDIILLLQEQNKMLRERVRILEARVAELERRLGMDSTNSSKPPSSDQPRSWWKRRRKKKSGRNRGGQPGHDAHFRDLVPVDQVSELTVVKPKQCDCCGSTRIEIDTGHPHRHQVVEIPPIQPIVSEWQLLSGICLDCGHVVVARLPAGVPSGNFGPRLQSLVALLSGVYHQSKRFTQSLLSDVFGVQLCLGSIASCEQAVSRALEAPVEEAHRYVQSAEVLHADETGWREGPLRAWLWVAATSLVTVFMVNLSRGRQAARQLLGGFMGALVSDRWGPYSVHKGLRQLCWAHLLRTFVGFSELSGKAGRIGDLLVDRTRLMFKWWHLVRDGTLKRKVFARRMVRLRIQIEDLLVEGELHGHPRMSGVCKRIIGQAAHLWTFIDHEGVEPTNNFAERVLRQGVLWRKISFGTQSEEGSRFVERILTATATCRQQGRNIVEYLNAACIAQLYDRPPPSLLPLSTQTA